MNKFDKTSKPWLKKWTLELQQCHQLRYRNCINTKLYSYSNLRLVRSNNARMTSLQRNEIFGCVHTDSIVSWTLNYVEKLTKYDTAPLKVPYYRHPTLSVIYYYYIDLLHCLHKSIMKRGI